MTSTRPRPRKRFGQHFLSPTWATRIVTAIDPQPGDAFLEIGPGTGAITLPLAATGAPILGVEIDRDLVRQLAPKLPGNVTLMSGDVLTLDVMTFLRGLQPQQMAPRSPQPSGEANAPRRFRVVGNLPYNVASPIILRLVDIHRRHWFFTDATVMVQREVADRLVARPGTKAYGALTILPRVHATITRLLDLPPGAFTPPPKVRSSLIRLEFKEPAVVVADEALFERLVKGLFMYRRKTLLNALKRFTPSAAEVLTQSGVDGRRRPETLTLAEIARLAELLARVQVPRLVGS